MASWGQFRIVDEPNFWDRAAQVIGSLPRWDEIRSGLDFELSIDPRLGWQITTADSGTEWWMVRLSSSPILVIYYTIGENGDPLLVTYRDIKRLDGA